MTFIVLLAALALMVTLCRYLVGTQPMRAAGRELLDLDAARAAAPTGRRVFVPVCTLDPVPTVTPVWTPRPPASAA